LPALSLLVLVANRAFQWEQRYRYDRDVRRHQDKYRQEQEDIELPAIQKGALAL
jgi:hypothetical protein